jgi:hypothetical protein
LHLPYPEQLYPVPQLAMTREEGRILRVAPPSKAEAASEILQIGMIWQEDADHPPEVVTGIARVPEIGEGPSTYRWIERLILNGNAVLVFLHTIVKGPIRFVATSSPMLVAALAQPVHYKKNYAWLDGPGYLLRQAQQLAQGGKATWTLPRAQQVNSFVGSKAAEEGSLSPPPDVTSPPSPTTQPTAAPDATAELAWLAAGILVAGAVMLYIVRKQ